MERPTMLLVLVILVLLMILMITSSTLGSFRRTVVSMRLVGHVVIMERLGLINQRIST
ncbi:MAG: hypothetical protein M0008_06420 [Actinomycetota bacterium]|nr:hypothetical protein [Actinomycetota bacterium]